MNIDELKEKSREIRDAVKYYNKNPAQLHDIIEEIYDKGYSNCDEDNGTKCDDCERIEEAREEGDEAGYDRGFDDGRDEGYDDCKRAVLDSI